MVRINDLGLTPREKLSYKLHTIYMVLEGVILGILVLNEFVFIKGLLGSNYQMSFLFIFSMAVYIFLILINEFLKRVKNRKQLLRITGIITRGVLLLLFFFPDNTQELIDAGYYHYIFLAIFFVYYFGNTIINPSINYILKKNYKHENFGKLYSYSTSLNKIVMLVSTFIYGILLDIDPFVFRHVFPIAAVLGIVSLFTLTAIPYKEKFEIVKPQPVLQSIRNSIKDMSNIITKNHTYRHFQIGFMLYGFAFMISYTVITIFFYKELNLNYSSVAFYRNAYNVLAIVILPFFGKLLGDIDPRRFAIYTYASIALYILMLAITKYVPYSFDVLGVTIYYTLILYILAHGVFAATMVLLWNIGSAYFCKPEEAGSYQSVHLVLTGMRSLVSPLLGVVFYEAFGFTVTFFIAIASLIIGMIIMKWSYTKYPTVEIQA
ncbi:MAG: MFS transporter [Hyphomicrobiales bacterium]